MTAGDWPHIEFDLAWYEAIPVRVSRRRFDGRPVADSEMTQLLELADELSGSDVRITVVESGGEEIYTGLVGAYGKVAGAPGAAIFSAPEGWQLQVGYVGEAFILAATSIGIDTCWLAGSFDRKSAARRVRMAEDERVWAATPLGYGLARHDTVERAIIGLVRARSRLPAEEIAPGVAGWPDWARSAVDAARLAPSGGNRQPWHFALEGDELALHSSPRRKYPTQQLDRGIAMLHAELGALAAGVEGQWEVSENLPGTTQEGLARFVPTQPLGS